MKLVPEELHTLDTTILVPEELYALDTRAMALFYTQSNHPGPSTTIN